MAETQFEASANVINSIFYLNPFVEMSRLPAVLQTFGIGINVAFTRPGSAATDGVYVRLLQNGQPIAYFASNEDNYFSFMPAAPLAPAQFYVLEMQFRDRGQSSELLNWNEPKSIYSAALTADNLEILDGATMLQGGVCDLSLTWATKGSANVPAMALYVQNFTKQTLVDLGDTNKFTDRSFQLTLMDFPAQDDYAICASAVIPCFPTLKGDVSTLVALGAPSAFQMLPTKAPDLEDVSFDGRVARVKWMVPRAPTDITHAAPTYEVVLLDHGSVIATQTATREGGEIEVALSSTMDAALTVAGRMSYGPIVGGPGVTAPITTARPCVTNIDVTDVEGGSFEVSVHFNRPPRGTTISTELISDDVDEKFQEISQAPWTTSWTIKAPDKGQQIKLGAFIASNISTGPSLDRISIPSFMFQKPPVITDVVLDGCLARARWAVDDDFSFDRPMVQLLLVNAKGETLAQADASESGGVIDVGDLSTVDQPALVARYRGPHFDGPHGPSSPLITARPVIAGVDISEVDQNYKVEATFDFKALPAGQSVTAALYEDGALSSSTTVSEAPWSVSWSLPKGASVGGLTLDARVTTPGASGPQSLRMSLPSSAFSEVKNLVATYDDVLKVNFDRTEEPLAQSYEIALSNGHTVFVSDALPAVCDVRLSAPNTYTLAVRPIFNGCIRGVVSAPGLVRVPFESGDYLSGLSDDEFYIYPPNFNKGEDAVVYLPSLLTPGVAPTDATLEPTVVGGQTQTLFTLSWATQGQGQTAQIAIDKGAFEQDAASRKTLSQAFGTFREQVIELEQRELKNSSGRQTSALLPGGAFLLINRAASALNLSYKDSLSYFYNLQHNKRRVDLIPGMRLRIEPAGFSFHAPPSRAGHQANGYATTGTYFLNVNRDRSNTITFNPWSTAILASQVTPSGASKGIGRQVLGLLDLSGQGMAKKHWRLIWPEQFGGVESASDDPDFQHNVALIGGDTFAELTEATEFYTNGTATKNGCCAYLSGRGIVIPEIAVTFNGEAIWVGVGTTLRQVLSGQAEVALPQMAGPIGTVGNVFDASLTRWSQSPDGASYVCVPVQLPSNTAAIFDTNGDTQWDVPLLMGDEIQFLSQSGQGSS